MKNMFKIITLFSFLWTVSVLNAQDATAPDLDAFLEKYYETIGGVDAWKQKTSMKITGKSDNMGMSFPVTVLSMRPNLQKVEVDIQGQQYVEAYDGEVAWTINPFMGSTDATKKTEEESKEAAKNSFEDDLIDWRTKGHQVSMDGTEEIDGVETVKVKLVKSEGDERIYFFDPENYIPIMFRSFISTGPMKGKAVDTYVSDFDEVDGVMVPFSMEQKIDGQTFMKMRAETVEFNVELDKATFVMPAK